MRCCNSTIRCHAASLGSRFQARSAASKAKPEANLSLMQLKSVPPASRHF